VADAGFTPSVRRLPALLELLATDDDDLAANAERAILRIERQYATRVAKGTVEAAKTAERPARGRLTRLAGRLAREGRDPDGVAFAWLLEALGDADPKTRRAAARGLGNLDLPAGDNRRRSVETALASAWDRAESDDDRRPLALALGKIGGDAARARLARGAHGRASIMATRELARREPGAIDPARAHDGPLRIWFHTRSGLEDVTKDELASDVGVAQFVAPGVVEATLEGPLSRALAVRTATHVGFPLPSSPRSDDLAADVARALASPPAMAVFRAFTSRAREKSPIRFRLDFVRGGHRRSLVWRCAEMVHELAPDLVNDPRESTWDVVVDDAGPVVKLELVPRGYDDERFAWRKELVSASSHPVIAAALARVAPRRDDDVVWDPFVGAGAELVERARLGPYARLIGTDIDARAVAAARSNIARAGVERATIERADACEQAPEGVTLVLTNPPMGRRVERGRHADLLERFVAHAARVLVPGGALVWLVPEPGRVRTRAATEGLDLRRAFTVDMGGFPAELSIFVKRVAPEPRRRVVSPKAKAGTPKAR
jgi:predicted RNA methylase